MPAACMLLSRPRAGSRSRTPATTDLKAGTSPSTRIVRGPCHVQSATKRSRRQHVESSGSNANHAPANPQKVPIRPHDAAEVSAAGLHVPGEGWPTQEEL